MDKVSIIVPVYNVENYLNQCITSIVHQTYRNLEIILIDDGSPDTCPQLCDEWAKRDDRVKVIHKQNGGLSDARNVGLSEATGKYILFVDSDDWISLNMVSNLVQIMENENADMSICQFANVFPDGRIEANSLFEKSKMVLNRKAAFNLLIEDTSLTNHVWRKMYKRELISKSVFPKGKNFEDIYAMPSLLEKCKRIVCINKVEYFYRQNDEGIIQNKSLSNYKDQIDALEFAKNKIISIEPRLQEKVYSYQIVKLIGILRELVKSRSNDLLKLKEIVENNILSIPISTYKDIPGKTNKLIYLFLKRSDKISLLYNAGNKLKKIYRPIKNKKQSNKDKKELLQKITQNNRPKFYIIGTPEYGNLGDQALMFGEFEFINKYFPNYTIIPIPQRQLYMVEKVKNYITKEDIVALQAGGNIGTLYPGIHKVQEDAIFKLRDKNLIIFPQTFFYENSEQGKKSLENTYEVYKRCKNLTVFVRDDKSLELLHKYMPKIDAYLVPDMVLMLGFNGTMYDKDNTQREGALILLRHDSEQTLIWEEQNKIFTKLEEKFNTVLESDMHMYHDFESVSDAKESVKRQLQLVRQSELVVTDRLHGMIFAYLTNTPCIVLKSKSPKILGVYQWIKNRKNICLIDKIEDMDQKLEVVEKQSSDNNNKIEERFSEIAKIIKEKGLNGVKNN